VLDQGRDERDDCFAGKRASRESRRRRLGFVRSDTVDCVSCGDRIAREAVVCAHIVAPVQAGSLTVRTQPAPGFGRSPGRAGVAQAVRATISATISRRSWLAS
jgi:hypothetical protein